MANVVAYGFYNLQDVFAQRVNTIDYPVLNRAIDATLEEHNRQLQRFINLFVQQGVDYKTRFKSAGARRLQPLDEHGRARPSKSAAAYDVAFPIQMGGDAIGQTYLARAKMTVEELNNEIVNMMLGDKRWMFDHMLAALFAADEWTFVDEEYGTLTVQSLADGDSTQYLIMGGQDTGATDDHIQAQANAIGAGADNPFPAIYTDLSEHPENGADPTIISFIPTGLKASVEALASFHEEGRPELRLGTNTTQLTATLDVPVPGTVIGFEDSGVWVVEWPRLPAGYVLSVAVGGDKPVGMREDTIPELRGFKRVADRDDHPYYESQYLRRAGFGIWNRVGARVDRIGNGTYAVPSGYASPMP